MLPNRDSLKNQVKDLKDYELFTKYGGFMDKFGKAKYVKKVNFDSKLPW